MTLTHWIILAGISMVCYGLNAIETQLIKMNSKLEDLSDDIINKGHLVRTIDEIQSDVGIITKCFLAREPELEEE